MSTYQRRQQEPNYFHPRNREGYWRATIRREMERMESEHPGIFNKPPTQQQEAR